MTEPTEPRTHRTTVVPGPDYAPRIARMPDGTKVGTPVVVSTVPPDGLWPGPDGTWSCRGIDLPEGWQWSTDGIWRDWLDARPGSGWMQVRPVPAPEPATERVPLGRALGHMTPAGDHIWSVTDRTRDGGASYYKAGDSLKAQYADDDGCVEAKAALVALVRRDRPQPTAEQAELLAAAEALGTFPLGAYDAWKRWGNTDDADALDAWKAGYERLRRAVDACRTEGTGE